MLSSLVGSSVGGADYGTVRAGAFMARRIIGTLEDAARAGNFPGPIERPYANGLVKNAGMPPLLWKCMTSYC